MRAEARRRLKARAANGFPRPTYPESAGIRAQSPFLAKPTSQFYNGDNQRDLTGDSMRFHLSAPLRRRVL
jgi:hypothetical protein